ncbi:MAG: hypothetical protein CM15mP111_1030 [Hyphomicrobiales bacterium]|nr:MAG: hypothetical protein CM15mP111_1030 [Hyphomicrobiales bacterium]
MPIPKKASGALNMELMSSQLVLHLVLFPLWFKFHCLDPTDTPTFQLLTLQQPFV